MADAEFTEWCTGNGIVFNGISAAFVSEGWRGIIATKDLQPGEVVLRVPERLLLTTRSAARDPQLAAALQRHRVRTGTARNGGTSNGYDSSSGLSALQVLACHLLLEVSRGPDSFWWPYLRQLPRSYTSLANFSPEDVAAMQLQHACDAAAAAAERAREEWRGALPVLQDLGLPKRFTALRAWLWATSTLHSRTMYLPWCPAGALTPYGDFHNYQPPPAPYTPQLGPLGPICHGAAASGGCRRSTGAPGSPPGQRPQSSGKAAPADSELPVSGCTGGPGLQLNREPQEVLEPVGSSVAAPDRARHGRGAESLPPPATGGREVPAAAREGAADGTTVPAPGSAHAGFGPTDPSRAEAGVSMSALTLAASVSTTSSAATGTQAADPPAVDCCRPGDAAAPALRTSGAASMAPAAVPGPLSANTGDGGGDQGPTDSASGATHGEVRHDGCQGVGEGAAADVTGAPQLPAGQAGGGEGGAGGDDGGCDHDWSFAIAGDGLWDEAAQQYHIVVRRPYHQGEQVMLCYGRYTNLELLEHYGFVLQDNPHDTALLDMELLPLGASGARTAAGAPHLAPEDCFLHANGQPSWQLLHCLRYAAASPAERRSAGHLMAAGERVSEQGDRQVLQWLYAGCSRQLAVLPTLLGQDLDILQLLKQGQMQGHLRPQHEPGLPPRPAHSPPGAPAGATFVEESAAAVGAVEASGGGGAVSATAAQPPPVAALSDGLTCSGLALRWRILQKQILQRAMRCVEQVLGPEAGGSSPRACKTLPARDLNALIQAQRQRRPDVAISR